MSAGEKLLQMVLAIAVFFAAVAAILVVAGRFRGRWATKAQAAGFVVPALFFVALGLLYPAVRTIYNSFTTGPFNRPRFTGLDNYTTIFTNKSDLVVLENTAMWVILTPILATLIGLVYAVLVDHSRFERFAKALIFLPMAISLVGASIIWKFVYDPKIGLLNAVSGAVGLGDDHTWYASLTSHPWNNIWLIIILIWVQTGFAMTVLSASIKAIPNDIVEAARLDGVGGLRMFWYITVPSIRSTIIVVLTTITITALKSFDIIQTISAGGAYKTSVLAYEFYFQQFKAANNGLASALAVLIFVLVMPIVIYNIRQMRKAA